MSASNETGEGGGRILEGPELTGLIEERRACGHCGGRGMRAVRFEETASNYYLTFECPDCGNSILIESPGMAGVRAALYLLVGFGYLVAMKLYDVALGAGGIALFSVLAVFVIWNGLCIMAPLYHAPHTGGARFDATAITGERRPGWGRPVRRFRYLKYDSFLGGFLAALAGAAAIAFAVVALGGLFGG